MQSIQNVRGVVLKKNSLLVMATVALIAAFAMFLIGFGSQKVSAAGCTINVYQVQWPAAGLYNRYWPHEYWETKRYPDMVSGPHGYHRYYYNSTLGAYVTAIGYRPDIMAHPYNYAIMKSDALKYAYCY